MERFATTQKHPLTFPNDSLEPDWDVVNEIVINLTQLSKPPTINYVKSHQDRKKVAKKVKIMQQAMKTKI